MSMIKITDNEGNITEQECAFSFEADYDYDSNILTVKGVLSSEGDYIYDVSQIESDRYIIKGVRITGESYGSETKEIVYSFIASEYEIK